MISTRCKARGVAGGGQQEQAGDDEPADSAAAGHGRAADVQGVP